jgi:hypothetical protein
MNFCQRCGSSSRDKDGFCGGCSAPWPLETVTPEARQTGNKQVSPISQQLSPLANLPPDARFFGLNEIRPKKVWFAVALALMLGPFGLLYCTVTGTIVMTVASIVLWFLLGKLCYVLVPLICAVWAWRAARESPSILD